MPKADRVHSTPPTSTTTIDENTLSLRLLKAGMRLERHGDHFQVHSGNQIVLARTRTDKPLTLADVDDMTRRLADPVADPTRRLFLTQAAGIAAAGTALALAAIPPTPAAAAPAGSLDRRALEAYASWLFMERRILCSELWPDMGAKAERYDYFDNAGAGWHFRGDGDWQDLPQPSTRAAAVLDLVGVDWRQPKEDLGLDHEDTGHRPELPAGWPAGLPDPVFGVIEAHRTAWAAYQVAYAEHVRLDGLGDPKAYLLSEAPCKAQLDVFDELIETAPTTFAGLQAWAAHLDEIGRDNDNDDMFIEAGPTLVATLVEALGNLGT